METCFKLLSCDGSYTPFNSNEPSLSGYVDTFITIDLLGPLTGTPETQFLVKYLGEIDCVTVYVVSLNQFLILEILYQ